METLLVFDFLKKGDVENFFAYIFSNVEAKVLRVKIFAGRYDFICGINPRRVSEEQELIGPDRIISRLPICDHKSGKDMMELEREKIKRIEIFLY